MTSPPPTERPAILIVDDEIDVLESLRHLLHRKYRVITAQTGQEALRDLNEQDVQVILCDQRMPGMTGDEILEAARKDHPDVVRLLFTGYADVQAVTRAVNHGEIFRYILKPWDVQELEAVVAQAFEQFRLVAERTQLLQELRSANEQLSQANRELETSNALKTAFLQVASHELNTPITIIQGLNDVLALSKPDRDPQEASIIQQMGVSTRQLARIVGNMLKLNQANDYRHALRTEPIELNRFLHATADQLQPIIDSRRLSLRREISDTLGMIEADPNKLRDVVVNLLSNAIKFSPDGSELAISANSADDECVIIRVIDHGIGADAQVLSRMFEPFFTQLDTSTHSTGDFGFRKRGMGLGLSLVRRFVELHGGTVRAESEPGKGTVVIVRWPRRPPASSMLESTGSPSGTGS